VKHTHGYLKRAEQPDFFDRTRKMMSQTCQVCGCTETTACMTGGRACHWVSYNLCSACKEV
jgi:hypothetical protein